MTAKQVLVLVVVGACVTEDVEVTELFAGFGPDITPDGTIMVFAVMDADGTADLYESRR